MPADFLTRFLRPLRSRPLTQRYPHELPVLPAAMRGLPVVDPARCDSSAACVTVCPTSAIELSAGTWTLDIGRCVFCGACEAACPRDAIRLGSTFELAALTRDALVVSTRIGRAE